jgi:SprT protein
MSSAEDLKEKIAIQLEKYLPVGFSLSIAELFLPIPVKFKIVNPRNTKLGDYRPAHNGLPHRISINGNLNPYSFLITTIHEFAHLNAHVKYGSRIQPHGNEWKKTYRELLIPIIESKLLPQDIEIALMNSLVNTKASSCSDIGLSRVLKNYDKQKDDYVLLEQLAINTKFTLQGKLFIKGPLRRKRFICEEIQSKKKYLIYAIAEVIPIFDN